MKKSFLLLVILIIMSQGCMYAVRYDGTYKGKVIDEETREPIEGVVVLGVWNKEQWGAAGTVSTYYDARETVTDKNGEFKIRGHGLRVMTNLAPMNVLIFKAGYTYHGTYPWEAFINTFKTDDGKPLVPIRKLTMEERKRFGGPSAPPDEAPFESIKLMLKEIDKDDIERGLPPRMIWKGHKIDHQ